MFYLFAERCSRIGSCPRVTGERLWVTTVVTVGNPPYWT